MGFLLAVGVVFPLDDSVDAALEVGALAVKSVSPNLPLSPDRVGGH